MTASKSQGLLDAVEREDESSVRALLASRVDVNVRDKGGSTPLMRASLHGDLAIVELLIAEGANLDVHDKLGKTALHYAAQEQHPAVVERLVAAGAHVNSQDEHGNSPLSMAVFYSKGAGETITLLRKKGADDNIANKHGVTPRALAKTIANFDVLKFFSP
ncbi:MAG: hypothetical protein JWM32_2706 [Verrucomicrobia bacterium]|nr:hypothetical protein [Verrucomicrobiota bacterium]